MVDLSGVDHKSLVDRAKAIILRPAEEWQKIATETTPQGDVLKGYVLPLAAIGPIASLIGGQLFGYGAFGFSYRPPLVASIISAIVSYALGIAAVYVMMFIADFLAPKFGGQSNRDAAFKYVAYSYTAGWLAGIFGLIPALAFFGLLGIYSVYLLYTGAPLMMKVPQDKAAGYTAVTILCAIVLMLVMAPITAAIAGLAGFGAMSSVAANNDVSGTLTVPGVGSVDMGKVQQMGKQAEDAANGKSPPVDTAKLAALLPTAIGAYQRTATESTGMGQMGSTAEATYTAGDKSMTLRIIDQSAMGALAGLGAAMGVQNSREDADGYSRTTSVDGQMQTEEWNKTSGRGKFGHTIANRFMVEAEGNVGGINDLKAAVAAIDPDDLTDLVE